jgi:hypothetical protein
MFSALLHNVFPIAVCAVILPFEKKAVLFGKASIQEQWGHKLITLCSFNRKFFKQKGKKSLNKSIKKNVLLLLQSPLLCQVINKIKSRILS